MAKKKKEKKEGIEEAKEEKLEKKPKRGFFRALFRIFFKFVIGVIITAAILAIAGFFIYSYYPIKTIDVCINKTATMTPFSCGSDNECSDAIFSQQQGMPDFIKQFMKSTFSDLNLIRCVNNTCEIRMPRGLDLSKPVVQCTEDEESRVIEITARKIVPPETLISFIKQFIQTGQLPFSQSSSQ